MSVIHNKDRVGEEELRYVTWDPFLARLWTPFGVAFIRDSNKSGEFAELEVLCYLLGTI